VRLPTSLSSNTGEILESIRNYGATISPTILVLIILPLIGPDRRVPGGDSHGLPHRTLCSPGGEHLADRMFVAGGVARPHYAIDGVVHFWRSEGFDKALPL
jgi:hypothetical protein